MAKTKIPGYSQPTRPDPGTGTPTLKWVLVGLGVVVVAALVVAVAVTANSSRAGSGVDLADVVRVAGEDLPELRGQDDPAVGRTVPTLSGTSVTGEPVELSGGPRVVVVVAHWCPHCQAEVPRITELVDTGQWPGAVALQYVSTAQDRTKGNWSPSRWLEREGVTAPVLVDDAGGTAGRALGVQGFPLIVGVAADGKVAWRVSGEQDSGQLLALAQSLVPAPAPAGDTSPSTPGAGS